MAKVFVFLAFVLFGCNHESSKNCAPVLISNSLIKINHYEDDSLNKARRPVLPVIYFDFVAINTSDSLFNLVINARKEEEEAKLFVTFFHEGRKDTLVLTDFESFRVNKIKPNDTTEFTVAGFIPEILPEKVEVDYSTKGLMKSIAESGELYYFPSPSDQDLIEEGYLLKDTLHIKRSKNFEIIYRDPNDTTIE